MKLTNADKTLAAVFTVALTAIGFTAHAENIPGVPEQPASYFYTGKPYDADLGAYVFNARNYNPEISRWTSADPSGFPDGANAYSIVRNCVTTWYDDSGLTGKSVLWVYAHELRTDVYNGEGTDASMAANLESSRDEAFGQMNQWDLAQTGPNYTHYIDDGDTLDVTDIWSLPDLSTLTGYDYIMMIVHGISGAAVWGVNGTNYTTAQINSAFPSNIQKYWDGCGNYVGGLSESQMHTNLKEKTYNFLLE